MSAQNASVLQSTGANGYGIFAQSMGGQVGNGGGNVNIGNTVAVSSAAAIQIFSKSAGGGMALSTRASIGGTGGSGGDGAPVIVAKSGAICTGNSFKNGALSGSSAGAAFGILAQSIGGGGRQGSLGLSAAVTPVLGASFAVGGGGSSGGAGALVLANNTGSISTLEVNSVGVLAQSVGSGGGNGDGAIALNSSSTASVAIAHGGTAGGGGAGGGGLNRNGYTSNATGSAGCASAGAYSMNLPGLATGSMITTNGAGSLALEAQSVGGGGGSGGFAMALSGSADAVVQQLRLQRRRLRQCGLFRNQRCDTNSCALRLMGLGDAGCDVMHDTEHQDVWYGRSSSHSDGLHRR